MLLQNIYGIESKANHLWIITGRCSTVNISRVFKASIFFSQLAARQVIVFSHKQPVMICKKENSASTVEASLTI